MIIDDRLEELRADIESYHAISDDDELRQLLRDIHQLLSVIHNQFVSVGGHPPLPGMVKEADFVMISDEIQKKLNQWKHLYHLQVLATIGTSLLVLRRPKRTKEESST